MGFYYNSIDNTYREWQKQDVIELLDKDDDALESYCSDPDEPVMSGSDDEFSDLEQENVDGKLLAYAIHARIAYHTCRCRVHC